MIASQGKKKGSIHPKNKTEKKSKSVKRKAQSNATWNWERQGRLMVNRTSDIDLEVIEYLN